MFNRKFPFCIVLLTLFMFLSCNNSQEIKIVKEEQNQIDLNETTKEMAMELKSIAQDMSNVNVWHLNRLKALDLDEKIKATKDPGQFISLSFNSGIEWLNAGEYNIAINRLNAIFNLIGKQNFNLPSEASYTMKEVLGMAYLRKAEIENCVQNHNEYSCIIPIEKDGQHVIRDGGEKALVIFRELLNTQDPKWQTKWLYNITHMTLGGYPDKVETKFLIDDSIFKSEVPFPRFKDIAMSVGVAVNDISGSVVMDDFNNDGYLDLMVSSYGLNDQLHYFQNNRNGSYDDLTESSGLMGIWSGLNMVQADYNNDGWVDVLVLRGAWLGTDGNHPNSLLKNNGDGTFRDVTKEAGLYCRFPTQTASWADFNNDGWIDLFIGNEHSQNNNATSQLFQNNGNGTFKDVSIEKGVAVQAFIKGCVWGDYNNDGYQDLYLSLINYSNYLLKNGGPDNNFKFTNEANSSKTSDPKLSFPCWFFDYNQDGWDDLFVSGFDFQQFESAGGEVAKDYLGIPVDAEMPKLYLNNKNETFTDVTSQTNVGKVLFTMGSNFGDLNNDGFPDFYAATGTPDFRALIPNRMFLNGNGKQFYDVTTAGGFGHLQKGHGVAFGDLDNDGDQDVYNVLGGSYDGDNFMNALFLNPGNQNNWVKLKLVGTTSNKSAIGAKIKIVGSAKDGGKRIFYNKVNSGGSFGANPLLIEQGLGDVTSIDNIEINWPGQLNPQMLKNVDINTHIVVTQNSSKPVLLNASAIKFDENGHHHH